MSTQGSDLSRQVAIGMDAIRASNQAQLTDILEEIEVLIEREREQMTRDDATDGQRLLAALRAETLTKVWKMLHGRLIQSPPG